MKIKMALIIACVGTALADVALHRQSHFGDHGIDGSLGFYALMSLMGCVAGIIVARLVSIFICVEDDFFDHA